MPDLRRLWRRANRFVSSFQVELRGHYSAKRIQDLDWYSRTTPTLWTLLICTLSPLPCLAIVTVIETAPMSPPTAGSSKNRLFWFRDFLAIALMTRAIVEQLRINVPGLKVTGLQAITMPVIASAGATAFMIAMSSVIGFPLPFALVVGVPIWFAVFVVSFSCCFSRALKKNPKLLRELTRYTIILSCQVLLTFVYPAYLYGFISVGTEGQTFYLVVLATIKIIAKNWICFFLDKKYDLMPQVIIFNVDVFNALYVSSSMQNSKSIATMLLLIAVDVGLAVMSMMDIGDLMKAIELLRRKIPPNHPLKSASFIDIALQILTEDAQVAPQLDQRRYNFGLTVLKLSYSSDQNMNSADSRRVIPVGALGPSLSNAAVEMFTNGKMTQTRNFLGDIFSVQEQRKFVQRAAQVLFTTEFVILVEYTKVIIPLMYSFYTAAMFYLPNRHYYPQLDNLDEAGLRSKLGNIVLFAGIELLSVLTIGYAIQLRIGVPMLHLLSFVLDRGWRTVQSNLFLWIFYTVQNSLQHNGADFSWSFKWLHTNQTLTA